MNFIKDFFDGMGTKEIVGQMIGLVAMTILVASFQRNTQKKILTFQLTAELLWVVHYALIGAYTGMALNLVGAARCYVFANRGKKWADKAYMPYLFFFFSIAAGLAAWTSPVSLLPIAAVSTISFALWSKKPAIIRIFSAPGCTCWLIFNIISSSYAGVLTEVLNLISITVGIIRYDIGKNKKATAKI